MSELRSLIEAARALRERGEPSLIATVVDVRGSSYRKPGARMLFTSERWLAGSVSGGCLERDVVAKGPWRTRDARARLVTYDGALDERSGSGCEGVIDVLIERAGAADDLTDPINLAARCLSTESAGVMFTAFRCHTRSGADEPFASTLADVVVGARHVLLASGESASTWPEGTQREQLRAHALQLLAQGSERATAPYVLSLANVDVLVELVVPPTHLFIFGGAHDAVPLLSLAKAIGWSVTVCEPHAQLTTRERFRAADHHLVGPLDEAIAALDRCVRPAAVVMAHHYDRDLAALQALIRSRAPYIGLLGARTRAARLLTDVENGGFKLDERAKQRLHAPVGLAIGAESPQEIALSIVAEIQAHTAQSTRAAKGNEAGHARGLTLVSTHADQAVSAASRA